MPSTLIFVRHAETDLAGRFCGHSDPHLNESGHAQLADLIERLAPYAIDLVVSSDLARARETAEAVANPRALPIRTCAELREIFFGQWEGLDWASIEAVDQAFANRWVSEFPHLAAPGGEAVAAFRHRVAAAVRSLREEAESQRTIAIFTHAGVIRALLEDECHFSAHHAWERTRGYATIVRCTQTSPASALQVHL